MQESDEEMKLEEIREEAELLKDYPGIKAWVGIFPIKGGLKVGGEINAYLNDDQSGKHEKFSDDRKKQILVTYQVMMKDFNAINKMTPESWLTRNVTDVRIDHNVGDTITFPRITAFSEGEISALLGHVETIYKLPPGSHKGAIDLRRFNRAQKEIIFPPFTAFNVIEKEVGHNTYVLQEIGKDAAAEEKFLRFLGGA